MDSPKAADASARFAPTPEVKLHFLDYWRIIRIRKTVVLTVFLLVIITTAIVTFSLTETYSSKAVITLEKDQPDVRGIDFTPTSTSYDPFWLATEFERMQSTSILYPVITNLDLTKVWPRRLEGKDAPPWPMDHTYAYLKNNLNIKQLRSTAAVEIWAFSDDKEEAAAIANAVATGYEQHRKEQRKTSRRAGLAELQTSLSNKNVALDIDKAALNALRNANKVIDIMDLNPQSTVGLALDALRKYDAQRVDAKLQYDGIYTVFKSLSNKNSAELRNALALQFPDTFLDRLNGDLATAEQNLAVMKGKFGEKSQELQSALQVKETVERQLEDRVKGIMESLVIKVSQNSNTWALAEKTFEEKSEDQQKLTTAYGPYIDKKRLIEEETRVRDAINIRVEQEQLELRLPTSTSVEVINPAEPSRKAVRPNKPLNIALGVVVGLMVGIGLAFFIEYLDTSVKTIDDVERSLQAAVLGVIPQNVGSLLKEGPESPHAEAYRVLRTNILFSRKDEKMNTLTVISGGAGEGKSTTMFNLATVFAQNGDRVLIIDSDLRRPSIHKILGISNSVGLTNYLLKQNSLEEVIQTTSLPLLDFMPSGKLPSSSMGILNSVQMRSLITEVKRRYDFVFFDSPPILGVSDGSILASEVDMVLQVIQYRRYPQQMTLRAKQMIAKVGGNLLGIVLNNINMSQDENYYYYSGYYHDYYSKKDDEPVVKPSGTGKQSVKDQTKLDLKQKF